MAGFTYRGNLKTEESARITRIIANDETVAVGDAVKASSGYVAVCDANDTPVLGIVEAIVDSKGIDLDNAPAANYHDATWTSSTQTVTVGDDNTTDDQVQAIVNVDPYALWLNDTDADLSESDVFQFFSLVDEDQIDGDTNSATVGEFQLMERDPDAEPGAADVSNGLFRISCSALHSYEPET